MAVLQPAGTADSVKGRCGTERVSPVGGFTSSTTAVWRALLAPRLLRVAKRAWSCEGEVGGAAAFVVGAVAGATAFVVGAAAGVVAFVLVAAAFAVAAALAA